MISIISYHDIYPIWRNHLWPNRKSEIEAHSAMLYMKGYDLKNYEYTPSFFAYKIDDEIVGVNSGHMCCDNSYRSRGLFVFPKYRKQGIGKELLEYTIKTGIYEGADFVWSYPRKTSWRVYTSAGFELSTEWFESEIGENAFCIFKFGAGAP